MIEVKNLKKDFGKHGEIKVLRGITETIEKGEKVVIIGPSGSGKSTFLRCLNLLEVPTSGEIWFEGTLINDKKHDINKLRQKLGMVFQHFNLFPHLSIEENICLAPVKLKLQTKDEARENAQKLLRRIGLLDKANAYPSQLSGGQKQRVAIAGVVAMKPKCIIMDEPTAMLDPNGRREVINTVMELNRKEKVTIILITHYMDEAAKADKIFVMDKGKVIMEGTPREIFSQVEKMQAIRLDVPQATELAYMLNKSGIPVPQDVLTPEELVDELCRLY